MGLLGNLAKWLGPAPPLPLELRRAIDHAVESVEPSLKAVSGYERRLEPAVRQAQAYCRGLVDGIPGPVGISAQAFAEDPLVHALFATAADIDAMLGNSRDVREFLSVGVDGALDCACALLGVRRHEKSVLGMAMDGEVLRSDVAQKLIYFSDHTLFGMSGDPEHLHARLEQAAFDSLLQSYADQVAEWRRAREEAYGRWSLARAQGQGLEAAAEALRQATGAIEPERLLEGLADWLAEPSSHLRLAPTSVAVDRAGVVADGGCEGCTTLAFPELVGRDRRHWLVLLVRIRRSEAREAVDRHDRATRYIVI